MKNSIGPVYTEATECRDCYKCVRNCPVKSIEVRDNSAYILTESCISCGRCVVKCPSGAKHVRSDLNSVRELIAVGARIAVSVAPSYHAFLDNAASVFRRLGRIPGVTLANTAEGAGYLNADLRRFFAQVDGKVHISTACPAVVDYVRKYKPELVENLTPFASPLRYHSASLRQEDPGCTVVFAGPCAAKHLEKNQEDGPDFVLSFAELSELAEGHEERRPAGMNAAFPIRGLRGGGPEIAYPRPGGMIDSLGGCGGDVSFFHFSGLTQVFSVLDDVESYRGGKTVFLELLACEGGCINGPLKTEGFNALRGYTDNTQDTCEPASVRYAVSKTCPTVQPLPVTDPRFDRGDLDRVLASLGKGAESKRLDCGGCGYDTCENFARALLSGKAEEQMCVTNMRKIAQKKVNALMKTIPFGVVLVNPDLHVLDANERFLRDFFEIDGFDNLIAEERLIGLSLADVKELSGLFGGGTEKPVRESEICCRGRKYACTVFTVEEGKVTGALFKDITRLSEEKEIIVEKSREVIEKNLNTVQQIASLLGETAAETEIILNSLINITSGREYGK